MIAVKHPILSFAATVLLTVSLRAADSAAPTNAAPSSATTFESFRIISERNIFNQNRSARSNGRGEARSRPVPVVQSLSLVGTMSFEKGDFAFFDGSRPEYKKPLQAGDKIAGYEIKEIQPNQVKIASETQQFEIKVGQQLRREDESEWQLSTSRAAVSAAAAESSASPAEVPPSSGNSSEDEALKRLMEKRAKELNQ